MPPLKALSIRLPRKRLTDVGVFQCPDVVGSVAAHQRVESESLQFVDDVLLLLRGHPGKDADIRQEGGQEVAVLGLKVRKGLKEGKV